MSEWGPLQPLQELVMREEYDESGEKDRKQADLVLARALGSEELSTAIKHASLEQLDLALMHDTLAVEQKPICALLLLTIKGNKIEQWRQRRGAEGDSKAQYLAVIARFLPQISQLLYQVPMSVATKEIMKVSGLVIQYSLMAVELQQSLKTIYPLKSFLRRLHQHGNTALTPIHSEFLYLCLHAKSYFAAMEILDQPLFEIHSQANLVDCVDFLRYAYYGGMLYVGEKRFQDAIDFFLMVITAPAVSLSAFVVDAYKKLVLVSLIQHGELPLLPKYTPFVVTRHIESHCGSYFEFGKAFMNTTSDLQQLCDVLAKHTATFTKDNNLGLAKQCVTALKRQKLLQLTRTYATIASPEMAKAVGLGENEVAAAEGLLLELIDTGHLAAVIDQQKKMVTFVLDDESDDDGRAMKGDAMAKLQTEMQKLLRVSAQLRLMDVELVTSAKFQSRVQKEKDRRQRMPLPNQPQGDERVGMETME